METGQACGRPVRLQHFFSMAGNEPSFLGWQRALGFHQGGIWEARLVGPVKVKPAEPQVSYGGGTWAESYTCTVGRQVYISASRQAEFAEFSDVTLARCSCIQMLGPSIQRVLTGVDKGKVGFLSNRWGRPPGGLGQAWGKVLFQLQSVFKLFSMGWSCLKTGRVHGRYGFLFVLKNRSHLAILGRHPCGNSPSPARPRSPPRPRLPSATGNPWPTCLCHLLLNWQHQNLQAWKSKWQSCKEVYSQGESKHGARLSGGRLLL